LVRFLLLTACRRTEARYMKRSEVVGDIWTVPPSRQKANLHHVVPLSKAAKAILNAMPVIDNSDLIFTNDGWRPVSPSKLKPQLDKESGVAGWTLHDLRRSARSLLSRAGVNADHAERCLGHVIGGVRGVYDRHAYLDEKRHAFEALAALIKRIIDPQANIVSLRDAQ
jgi:integrase